MSKQIFQIFDLLSELIVKGQATFFYLHARNCKCCVIDDMAFEFYEEEEGSFRVRYQCLEFLWIRETTGWDLIRTALAEVTAEDEDDDIAYPVNKRMYASLHRRLLEYASKSEKN